jgi:hypothetical protein
MERIRRVVLAVSIAAFCGCALLAVPSRASAQASPPRPTLKVMFVGSSYTFVNNLGDVVAAIAASDPEGPIVEPTLAPYAGGSSLQTHLDNGNTRKLLASQKWDYVVLQETSLYGGTDAQGNKPPQIAKPPVAYFGAVKTWVPLIAAAGGKTVLEMTWGRRLPRPDGPSPMQKDVAEAVYSIARETGAMVAPVGLAFEEARRRMVTLELHTYDGSHPSAAGTYLAALVIYATITGRNPVGAPSLVYGRTFTSVPAATYGGTIDWRVVEKGSRVPLVDLRDATAAELQRVAWEVVSKQRSGGAPTAGN